MAAGGCRPPRCDPRPRFRTLAPRGSPRSYPSPAPQNPNHRAAARQPRGGGIKQQQWERARIGAGGDRAGSKRPRIGARTCGELTRGASDREIRGGGGSVAGGELPRPRARRRELPGLGAGWLPTPPPRARASSPWRARYRLGLWANASSVRKASSAASLLWEGGVETNEDGDAEHWVYPSPAGGEVSFIRPFYRPTIFRIAPVVPAVFANWSVLPGMLVYANPS